MREKDIMGEGCGDGTSPLIFYKVEAFLELRKPHTPLHWILSTSLIFYKK
jgi:hypothetical protein